MPPDLKRSDEPCENLSSAAGIVPFRPLKIPLVLLYIRGRHFEGTVQDPMIDLAIEGRTFVFPVASENEMAWRKTVLCGRGGELVFAGRSMVSVR